MKLDHVVYFTIEPLEEVIKQQREKGYDAVKGGRHEQWGTANALLYTENAYIEWLTVEDPVKAEAAAAGQPLVAQLLHDRPYGDGWGTVCFSVEDMEQWKDELDNKGFRTTDILPASRRTENGDVLRWKMLFIEQQPTNELPYPFFIEWEQPAQAASNSRHRIAECVFRVDDPLRDSGEWAVLLSRKVGDAHDIQIAGTVFRFVETQEGPERLSDVHLSDTVS